MRTSAFSLSLLSFLFFFHTTFFSCSFWNQRAINSSPTATPTPTPLACAGLCISQQCLEPQEYCVCMCLSVCQCVDYKHIKTQYSIQHNQVCSLSPTLLITYRCVFLCVISVDLKCTAQTTAIPEPYSSLHTCMCFVDQCVGACVCVACSGIVLQRAGLNTQVKHTHLSVFEPAKP